MFLSFSFTFWLVVTKKISAQDSAKGKLQIYSEITVVPVGQQLRTDSLQSFQAIWNRNILYLMQKFTFWGKLWPNALNTEWPLSSPGSPPSPATPVLCSLWHFIQKFCRVWCDGTTACNVVEEISAEMLWSVLCRLLIHFRAQMGKFQLTTSGS